MLPGLDAVLTREVLPQVLSKSKGNKQDIEGGCQVVTRDEQAGMPRGCTLLSTFTVFPFFVT